MSDPTRDYKKEYAEYHSTPEAKRDRAKRNLWNRRLKGKVPPGKEIDHTVPLSRGGSNDRDNIRFRDVSENRGHGMSKRAAPLTSRGRNQVAEGNFALPGRRYPIHDISHARNALSRVAQHGTRGEQEAVRSAVEARYPSLKKEGEFMPLYKEASVPFSTKTFAPGYTLGGAVLGGAAGLATSGQRGVRPLGGAAALSEEDRGDLNPFVRAAIGAGLGAIGGYGVKRLRDASHLSTFADLKEGDKVLKAHHYSLDNAAAHSGESAKDFVLRARAGRGSAKETALYKADGDKIMGIDTPAIEAVYDRGSKKTHYLVQDPKNPSSASLVSNVDKPFPLNKRDYVRIERADVDKAFLDDVKKQRSSARLGGAAALATAGAAGGIAVMSGREKRAAWVHNSLTFAKLAGVEYRGHTFPGYNQPIEAPDGDTHKMMVLAKRGGDVKLVRFGHRGYQHNYSPEAKANYLKRSAGIRDGSGNLTKDDPFSPNYWARKHLWPKNQKADGSALKKEASMNKARKGGESDAGVRARIALIRASQGGNESVSNMVANVYAEELRRLGHDVDEIDLKDVPYADDWDDTYKHDARKRLGQSHATVFATPVYNWGPSARLNAYVQQAVKSGSDPYRPYGVLGAAGSSRSQGYLHSLQNSLAMEDKGINVGAPIVATEDDAIYDGDVVKGISPAHTKRLQEHAAELGYLAHMRAQRRHHANSGALKKKASVNARLWVSQSMGIAKLASADKPHNAAEINGKYVALDALEQELARREKTAAWVTASLMLDKTAAWVKASLVSEQ